MALFQVQEVNGQKQLVPMTGGKFAEQEIARLKAERVDNN